MLEEQIGSTATETCCICEEIRTGKMAENLIKRYGFENRLFEEHPEFIVIPSISPLSEGHMLVFPKHHVQSMSQVPLEVREPLVTILNGLWRRLTKRYGDSYVFEHGVVNSDQMACGIDHAHIHVVPVAESHLTRVHTRIASGFPSIICGTVSQVLFEHKHDCPYLMYGNDLSSVHLSPSHQIPSQYVRKLIAEELESGTWDWKELSGVSEFQQSLI